MDVRVVAGVEVTHRIQHDLGLLGRRRVVKVDQRFPVDRAVEDGKVLSYPFDIQRSGLCEFFLLRRIRFHDSAPDARAWPTIDIISASSRSLRGAWRIRSRISLAKA